MHGFYSRAELEEIANVILGERISGRPEQGVYEQSAAQNFKLGASRKVKGGWMLHYCRAKNAITLPYRLAGNLSQVLAANELILTAGAAAGQKRVSIPDTTSPVNFYAGGKIECWPAGGTFEFHRIAASSASDGTNVVLTLEDPLITALAVGDMVLPTPSIYYATGPMGVEKQQFETAVAMPLIPVTAGYFYWGITWGPVFLSMQGGQWPGHAVEEKDVYCWMDGTGAVADAFGGIAAGTSAPQRVGYGLPSGDYGSGLIMLQLSP